MDTGGWGAHSHDYISGELSQVLGSAVPVTKLTKAFYLVSKSMCAHVLKEKVPNYKFFNVNALRKMREEKSFPTTFHEEEIKLLIFNFLLP